MIFKTYLKILKNRLKHFRFPIRFLFYKNHIINFVIKNYFLKLFSKIVTKQFL